MIQSEMPQLVEEEVQWKYRYVGNTSGR